MASELFDVCLALTMSEDDGHGKITNRTRTFTNIALDAQDDHLYAAAGEIGKLLSGNVATVVRIQKNTLSA